MVVAAALTLQAAVVQTLVEVAQVQAELLAATALTTLVLNVVVAAAAAWRSTLHSQQRALPQYPDEGASMAVRC